MALPVMAEPILRETSNLIWDRPEKWFGGFSGIEVAPTGETATLITDKGFLVRLRMVRNGAALQGLQLVSSTRLKHANGKLLQDKQRDAEGLAIGNDGTTYISFEHRHRVARLLGEEGRTDPLSRPDSFAAFELNGGLEALAIAPNGSLFTLPERSSGRRTPFPLYQYADGAWRIVATISRKGPFQPVGADFDANGLLYLLERATTPLGFRSRIRRFDLQAEPVRVQTLLTTGPSRFDNMESISLWQDTSGTTRITLISDDNFLSIQRTQVVEFALTE